MGKIDKDEVKAGGEMYIKPEINIPDGQSCEGCKFLLLRHYCILFTSIANINQKCSECLKQGYIDNP